MASSSSLRLLLISSLLCIFSLKANSLNYYWIGNSGNWSELSHWATTSGGSTLHTQIPTALDDVFFDANSFTIPGQSVNFDALTILAHNINWTGVTNTPELTSFPSISMRIYGSLRFVTSMTMNFGGPVYFEATTAGQTITTAGKVFLNDVAFNGIGGAWTLQDAFSTNTSLSLNAGVLNTNNQTVSALQFWSISNTTRELNMGASVFTLFGGTAWRIENTGFTVHSGTSVINVTAITAAFAGNTTGTDTYYDINFTGDGTGSLSGNGNFHDVVFLGTGRNFNSGSFHNVIFHKNGEIGADNIYNDLTFTAGSTYLLSTNFTQTVNGTFTATGTCASPISIFSNFQGFASTINHPPGTVNINFVDLRDIHATGGANFFAANSTDLTNNTGWTFIPIGIQNFFWIGNGGEWDDGNHWSHTSGGAPSGCTPTPLDNVFFDANSFSSPAQTVFINVQTANCRNMDWTGVTNTPTLGSYSMLVDLNIYGSLKFVPAMNLAFDGKVFFQASSPGQTITSAGKVFLNETRFNGAAGEWTLQDTFNSDTSIIHNCGTINTNNQTVNARDLYSGNFFPRILNLGSSVFNLHGSNAWTLGGGNLTFNCGTSVINITDSIAALTNSTQDINIYYDVNFTGYLTGALIGAAYFHDVSFSARGTIYDTCRFHTATFLGDGDILYDNVYDELHFSAGHTYRLALNRTQTVNGTFHALGTCESLITINSNMTDSTTFIKQLSGTADVSHMVLRDIHAIGAANFTAPASIDFGNNTGWIFNAAPVGQNLYWIGNNGNWNDGNHWSLTSGGPPSGCAPTPFDNVFFDGNSFSINNQHVLVNISTAYCKNMNWTGSLHNPTFESISDLCTLKIYGSLTFISGMIMKFDGKAQFEATTASQTIAMANLAFVNEIEFNGVGGEWTFIGAMRAFHIWLNNGTLNTNSQDVRTDGFYSVLNTTRVLNMGSSVFYIGGGQAWWVDLPGITVNCGTSIINCGNDNAQFIGNSLAADTYYDVNFAHIGTIGGLCNFHDVLFTEKGIINNSCNFHTADFLEDGEIRSDNVYDNLHFSAGHNYTLWRNRTQTVNETFNASGNCGGIITITSDMPDSTTTISHPPGAVDISYVMLRDIHATGGATFTANDCLDLGNNTGWTINAMVNPDLYWIGDSGNWDNGNHWSLTSGGPPSGCSPTALNNVFFDANSFTFGGQSVIINVPMAYCRNMSWTGVTNTPTIGSSLSINQLNIYGSLTFVPGMIMGLAGNINFEAVTTGQTITMGGNIFTSNVAFNGTGEWILQDGFAANDIRLNSGMLNTNDQPVGANSFLSLTGTARTLDMGSSVITLLADSAWRVENTGLTINSGTSTIIFSNVDASLIDHGTPAHTYYNVNFTGSYKNNIIGTNNFHDVNFTGKGCIFQSNNFNDVFFNQDGQIESSNVFHDLNFTAEHSYTVWEGSTQTVNNRWRIQGTCTEYILLQTNNAGFFATVSCAADTVFGHNIHLRDIHCTGTAAFMAYNSVDLGGNAGWNFTVLPPLTNIGSIIGPTTVCAGSTGIVYQVTAVQGAISYQWAVPPGATITGGQGTNTITVDFGTVVSGSITVQACGGCGCSNTSTSSPIVVSTPSTATLTLTAIPGNTICSGTTVTFTATVAGTGSATVSYDFKLNNTSVQNGSLNTYSTATLADGDEITCTITVSGSGCFASSTVTSNLIILTVLPQLTPAVSLAANPGTDICTGTAISFTATTTNTGTAAITYDFKKNGTSIQSSSSDTYTTSTLVNGDVITCTIFLSTGTANCFTSTNVLSNALTINSGHVNVNAGTDVSIPPGQTVQLNASGDIGTYLWSPATGLSATNILNPVAAPAVTTTYTLTITNASGCSGHDDIKVEVKDIPNAGCNLEPMIAFTPNGDGINDRWIAWQGNCTSAPRVTVVNRYGTIVFQSQQYQNDWQGIYKGKPLPDGTYYFVAEYKLSNGRIITKKNNVTILR